MKKIETGTFLDFKFVSNPTFSPDGSKIAFVVQRADLKDNDYKGDLYILDVETKKYRQLTAKGDAKGYTWTPGGKLLFPAKRTAEDKEEVKAEEGMDEREKANLAKSVFYEIDPDGGEAFKAFEMPLRAGRLEVVDEDLYVVSATYNLGEPMGERSYEVIEESPFWSNGRGFTEGLRGRVYLFRRSTGEVTPVTEPTFDASLCAVQDGKILYRGAVWEKGLRYESSGVYLYDIVKKETTCLLEPNTCPGYLADFYTEGKILVGSVEENENPGMMPAHFYTIDIETKEMKRISAYERAIGSSVGSDARLGGGRSKKMLGDKFFFTSTVDEGAFLRCMDTEGKVSECLTGEGSVDSFDINEDHTVVCGLFGDDLAELYLDGEKVTHFNDDLMAELDVRTPIYHEFINSDGISIHGYMMTPAGYEEGKKYPAILHIHGGPATVFGSVFHHEMQMWANAGFFVMFCNPRGSDGRGGDFQDICNKYGTIDYQDLMEFTDLMLEKYPDIDTERVGVTGGSYGGFMTNWIIGHTDRFKAACSQRSIANWTVFEHTSDIGYSFTKNHQGLRTRDNVDQLWEHSPLKYADKCVTPTLFIHSDNDYRCWMAEGLSMFTALKMHGCEARMVLFHGETHELSRSGKPRNRIRRMEEIVNWMKKYLM